MTVRSSFLHLPIPFSPLTPSRALPRIELNSCERNAHRQRATSGPPGHVAEANDWTATRTERGSATIPAHRHVTGGANRTRERNKEKKRGPWDGASDHPVATGVPSPPHLPSLRCRRRDPPCMGGTTPGGAVEGASPPPPQGRQLSSWRPAHTPLTVPRLGARSWWQPRVI